MAPRPRYGSLDDLRAVAILAVLVCHLAGGFFPGSIVTGVTSVGGHGVDLFFVLSGWLLGGHLFREATDTGTVGVRRFWVRRWLRTLPAYYAVLAATFVQFAVTGKWHLIDWRYLLFLQNYTHAPHPPPTLGVTWSLCVEEHFYLAVGPAVWLAYRRRWGTVLVLTAVAGLLTIHALGLYPRTELKETFVSHIRWEPCGVGVGLAWVMVRRPAWWAVLRRWAIPLFGAAVGMIVAAVLNRTVWAWALDDWGPAVWGLIFAGLVLLAVSLPGWRERRVGPVSGYLTSRAYALYLTHPDGIAAARKLSALGSAGQTAAAVLATMLAAELLYRLVERPFIRMRDRGGFRWPRFAGRPLRPGRRGGTLNRRPSGNDRPDSQR